MNKLIILSFIKKFEQEHNKTPSKIEFDKCPDRPCSKSTAVRIFGSWSNIILESGFKLRNLPARPKVTVKCTNCKKLIIKSPSDLNRSQNPFCSISCSAKYNNKLRTKPVSSLQNTTHKKHKDNIKFEKQTIYNIVNKWFKSKNPSATSKFASIRDHARRIHINKNSKCMKCGYNKHVNVCHIKPIKDFDQNTKIEIVNNKNNILILCPNHHWEFDHNLLQIENLQNQ